MATKNEPNLQYLMELLKQYNYASCGRHKDKDYLNIICTDTRCEQFLQGLCSICTDNNIHRKSCHIQKNLRGVVKQLIIQTDMKTDKTLMHKPFEDQVEEEIEQRYREIAKEYSELGNICFTVSKNILLALQQFKNMKNDFGVEKSIVRRIIQELLTDESERNLQTCLQQIQPYVYVDPDGSLQITDQPSLMRSEDSDQQAQEYIDYLTFYINEISQLQIQDTLTVKFQDDLQYNRVATPSNLNLDDWQKHRFPRSNSPGLNVENDNDIDELLMTMKQIALQIDAIKKTAVDEANRKGIHVKQYHWTTWEEMETNASMGWGIDGKHLAHSNGNNYCYQCYPVYYEAQQTIDQLKKNYHIMQDRVRKLKIN